MRSLRLAFVVVAAAGGTAAAQPQQEVVTLERAVELALKQQPDLRASQAGVEAARGRIDQVRVAQHPTVTLSAQAGGSSTPVRPCTADPTMTCGGFTDPQAQTALGAQISWRIWDFGQTGTARRAAELSADAAAANLQTTTLDIRTQVELAYLESVARLRLIAVAESTVKSEETHLDQAKRFVKAQAKDPIEVAQAQARAANAR
jgi:outer membrane protein TolC